MGTPFTNLAKAVGTVWQVIDFPVWEAVGTADATGTATMAADAVGGGEYWLCERLNLTSGSAFVGRVDVYEGDTPADVRRRDWALVPPSWPLVKEWRPPLVIRSNRNALVVVTNLVAGDKVTLSLSYAKVKRITA